MTKKSDCRISAFSAVCRIALLAIAVLLNARAADEPFRVDYSVEVGSTDDTHFHVVAEVQNIRQESLEFSLPVWTPGWSSAQVVFSATVAQAGSVSP